MRRTTSAADSPSPRCSPATSAPASASATAIAPPMPRDAPVTTARLPSRENSMVV